MSKHAHKLAQNYPIRAVARMTGISLDTLRAWERRYGAVIPGRNDRGRVYGDAEVTRLKRLADLVARGHAIGTIAGMTDADLVRLLEGAEALTKLSEPSTPVNLQLLISALDHYDLDAIESALNRYAVVLPPRELVFAVILPLLQEVGQRWEAGRLRPAQEHLVSAVVRSVLGGLLRTTARPSALPRIVFATPTGERHELGLLCAALLAASAGYGVVYLGPDLPAADITHAATTAGAHVVMVSLTMPGAVSRRELRSLAKPPAGIELWIGGPESRSLLSAAGDLGRHVDGLAAVIPMLARHAH